MKKSRILTKEQDKFQTRQELIDAAKQYSCQTNHRQGLTKKLRKIMITRRKLIESAKYFFESHGYRETKIDQITDHCLSSKGTFYAYFSGKEELFIATFEQTYQDLIALIEKSAAESSGNPAGQSLMRLLSSLVDFFEQDYYLIHYLLYREDSFKQQEMVKCIQSFQDRLTLSLGRVLLSFGLPDELKAKQIALSLIGSLYTHISSLYLASNNEKISLKEITPLLFEQFSPLFRKEKIAAIK